MTKKVSDELLSLLIAVGGGGGMLGVPGVISPVRRRNGMRKRNEEESQKLPSVLRLLTGSSRLPNEYPDGHVHALCQAFGKEKSTRAVHALWEGQIMVASSG